MARKPKVTRHAEKRINRGDAKGLRTQLTIDEVVERLQHPSSIRIDGNYYIWSPKDQMALYVVTARGGTTIITVHDTSREPTRLSELMLQAREGLPVEYKETPMPESYSEQNALILEIGRIKRKRDGLHWVVDLEVVCLFDCSLKDLRFAESLWFHQLVVSAVESERRFGEVSRRQLHDWYVGIHAPVIRDLRTAPIWVSYEVLGLPRPSS